MEETGNQKAEQSQPSGQREKTLPKFGRVKRVLAVMSGKGGVGKSTVSALLAAALARSGRQVGVLDADITGPSIPRMFGLNGGVVGAPTGGIMPPADKLGIKVMSLNLLLPHEDDPVIWRGPLIAGTVKQFWEEVVWGQLDVLVVDLPPGTGDVPLTVMQVFPLSGIVAVSSPQDLALMVVRKAVNMARVLEVPLLALIENMSYAVCPHCGQELHLFGPSRAQEVAAALGIPLSATLPLDPELSRYCDTGRVTEYRAPAVEKLAAELMALPAMKEEATS
ncbi:MAG: Mrp/NBP35 family ATP-binding protein [Clostridia bacterium]|nr:Mrp/NBP35 family ATP-binding protein [Clostridia bacterium]